MAAVAGTSLASALPDDAAREAANQERHMVSDFDAVPITFMLPHGEEWTVQFQSGQDIAFMKYTLHKEWGIPISVMTLVVGGDSLIDPMSIADYPELMDGSSQVTVAIPTGERYAEYEARLAAESSEGKAGDGKAPEGDGKVSGEGKE